MIHGEYDNSSKWKSSFYQRQLNFASAVTHMYIE